MDIAVNLPERTRDTVLPGDVGGLEEGGSPGPLTDDDGGRQTSLDHSTSGAIIVRKIEKSEQGG